MATADNESVAGSAACGRSDLPRRFEEAALVHDGGASIKITRWAYQQVARQGGQVWVKGKTLERLGWEWEEVFPA